MSVPQYLGGRQRERLLLRSVPGSETLARRILGFVLGQCSKVNVCILPFGGRLGFNGSNSSCFFFSHHLDYTSGASVAMVRRNVLVTDQSTFSFGIQEEYQHARQGRTSCYMPV